MNALLTKVIGGRIGWYRQIVASMGFVFGLAMVLLCAQVYAPLRQLLAPRSDYHEYVVLSKEVGPTDSLFPTKAEFSPAEIDELAVQNFVRRIGVFTASRFRVTAMIGGQLDFSTEMFLESVPQEFLDIVPRRWQWSPESNFLPVIISHDFLSLYNFGYAISSGLPKLSPATARLIPIEIEVYGPGGRRKMPARIVGFSHRVRSVLVPRPFMNWANTEIAQVEIAHPSKVMLHLEPRRQSDFREFVETHKLRVSQDQLNRGRAIMVLNIAAGVSLGMGLFFVTLAVTVMVMNFAVLLSDARDDLRLLSQLGYTSRMLSSCLTRRLLLTSLANAAMAAVFFVISWFVICWNLASKGVVLGEAIQPATIPVGIIFVVIANVISTYHIRRLVRTLCE